MIDAISQFGLSDPWKGLIDKYSSSNGRVRTTVFETVREISGRENGQMQLRSLIERIEKVANWHMIENLSFLHDFSQLACSSCSLESIAQDSTRLSRLLRFLVNEVCTAFAEGVLARFERSSYSTPISLYVSQGGSEILDCILKKFPVLTNLELGRAEGESSWCVTLKKCRYLTRLELNETPFSPLLYTQLELSETVQELVLYGVDIDDCGLQNMLKRAERIVRLELRNCPNLTCKDVAFPHTLKGFCAQKIPLCDKGLIGLAAMCYALEDLKVIDCLSLSDTAFERATLTSDITYLFLAAVPMSQKGLAKVLTHCDRLKVVHLWDCRGITSLDNCPFPNSITELSLTSFVINHLSLQFVLDCCPRLLNLIVEECKQIDFSKVSSPATLRALGLVRVRLTDKDAEALVSSCQYLQKVSFICCDGLSSAKAQELCDRVAMPSVIERLSSLFSKQIVQL